MSSRRGRVRALALLMGLAGLLGGLGVARAGSLQFCDQPSRLRPAQQDRLLRVAAQVTDELDRSGARVALVARAGLNLGWLGVRYSHAGFSLRESARGPWSVRQLYYACDEGRPRLFDQGLAGFLFGADDPDGGYLSIVLLPDALAPAVEREVLDPRQALRVLAPTYSANAYAYGLRYQNCNQWVAEMLAAAQGATADEAGDARAAAQQWLRGQGYEASVVDLGWAPLTWLTGFSPWLHRDDHPDDDLAAGRFRVSLPDGIERFVRATVPGATRLEVCHTAERVVIRRGWQPIADGCVAAPGDTVLALD